MKILSQPLLAISFIAALSGCASERYVNQQTTTMNAAANARSNAEFLRFDTHLSSLDAQTAALENRLGKVESSLVASNRLAQDALDRANASQQVTQQGTQQVRLAFEVTLTDAQIKFASGKAALNKDAEQVLTELAKKLKADNRNIYIEIQGHTDNVGSKSDNKQLGLDRAESVRNFLRSAGLPLHRMSVISYGSTQPVAAGKDRKAQAQNRRVVLMVLV